MPVDPLHGSLETYVPPDETDPTESIDAVDAAGTDAIPTSTPSLSGPQAVRESEQLQESVEALLEELHDMSVGDIQLDGELTEMEEEVSILCSHYIQKAGLAALRINALRNIMRDNNLTGDVDIEEFARSLKAEDLPGLSRGVLGPEDLIFLQDATRRERGCGHRKGRGSGAGGRRDPAKRSCLGRRAEDHRSYRER